MYLTGQFRVTEKYKGNSKFEFWQNLEVDDKISVCFELKALGRNRGLYSPQIELRNLRTGEYFREGINIIQNYLNKIKYIEVSY